MWINREFSKSDIKDVCKIVVLRRNFIDQCISYLNRRDFLNITIAWQWYLHPSYKKNLVNAEPFLSLGLNWARQCGTAMKWLSDSNIILKNTQIGSAI